MVGRNSNGWTGSPLPIVTKLPIGIVSLIPIQRANTGVVAKARTTTRRRLSEDPMQQTGTLNDTSDKLILLLCGGNACVFCLLCRHTFRYTDDEILLL